MTNNNTIPNVSKNSLNWDELIKIDDANTLMNELKDPNDWVGFFQLACENENWRATKPVLMDRVVEKIEKIAHEGQLPLASVRQICELAKKYFPNHSLNQEVLIDYKEHSTETIKVNSLLLETLPYYRRMLQSGMKESSCQIVSVEKHTKKFMQFIVQFLRGETQQIWNTLKEIESDLSNEKQYSLPDLADFYARSICEWDLTDLTKTIFSELKRRDPRLALELAFEHEHKTSIEEMLNEISFEGKMTFSYLEPGMITVELEALAQADSIQTDLQASLSFFATSGFSIELYINHETSLYETFDWGTLFRISGAESAVKSCVISRLNSEQFLASMIRDFPCIEVLHIYTVKMSNRNAYTDNFEGDEILALASHLGSKLKEIFLQTKNISNHAFVDFLMACPNLQQINPQMFLPLDQSLLYALKNCKDLKYLNLLTQSDMSANEVIDLIKNCSQLEELDLFVAEDIFSLEDLEVLFSVCPKLKKMNIHCTALNSDVLLAIAHKCHLLQHLIVFNASHLTKPGIEKLVENCQLKLLHLIECGLKKEDFEHLSIENRFFGTLSEYDAYKRYTVPNTNYPEYFAI